MAATAPRDDLRRASGALAVATGFAATGTGPGAALRGGRGSKNDQLFRSQFRKTELCAFHEQAWCSKGDRCPFAHGKDELRPIPDLTKTSLCRKWLKFSCRRASAECSFAHGTQELRMTEVYCRRRFGHGYLTGVVGGGNLGLESVQQATGGGNAPTDAADSAAVVPAAVEAGGAVAAGGGGEMQAVAAMYGMGAPQGSPAVGGPSKPWPAGVRFVPFYNPMTGTATYTIPALIPVPVPTPPALQGRPCPPALTGDFDVDDASGVAPFAMAALKAAFTPSSPGASTDGSSSTRSSNLGSMSSSVARAAGLPVDSSEELAEMLRGASPEMYED